MPGEQLNAGIARFLRAIPARILGESAANDSGIPEYSRGCAAIVMACAGRDRTGLRFDIILVANGQERSLVIAVPEVTAIAVWQRCAREHQASLGIFDETGALVTVGNAFSQSEPRRGGSSVQSRRPRFLKRRKPGAVAAVSAARKPARIIEAKG